METTLNNYYPRLEDTSVSIRKTGPSQITMNGWAVEGNRQFRMEMVRQSEVDQREISWRNWPYGCRG